MTDNVTIEAVTPGIGASVTGVSLATAEAETLLRLREALVAHQVLFIRDQELSPEALVALTERLGTILRVPYVEAMADYPDIIAVLKEAEERKISTFGGTWHSDFSFLERPPSFTLLHARELPRVGGDTLWASQYLAYESLSPAFQAMIEPLRLVHTGWPHGTKGPNASLAVSKSIKMVRNDPTADRETLHPLVRLHPESGRKSLFLNPVYTQRIEGMSEAESKPLLDFLFQHAVRPEFTCRMRWSDRTLAIWDNRCTLHLAVNDYDGVRRLLYRTTVEGERPLPAWQPEPALDRHAAQAG